MICPKCGSNNIDGSSFCIKCGNRLTSPQPSAFEPNVISEQNVDNPINYQQPYTNQFNINYMNSNNVQQSYPEQLSAQPMQSIPPSTGNFNYFSYLRGVLINPYKAFKSEETNLTNSKTVLIFSSIIAIFMMLLNLFITMFNKVFIDSYGDFVEEIDFSSLKYLDFKSLIFKNLLIYAGIIVGIAFVYYIVSLMFNKKINFTKLLAISTTSVIPYAAFGMLLSPIGGLIWSPIAIGLTVVGVVYSIIILICLIDENITFENVDKKIYFHLICLSVLACIGYYLYIKFIAVSIGGDLSDWFDFLE